MNERKEEREKRGMKVGNHPPSLPDLALSGVSINFAALINLRKYISSILDFNHIHSEVNKNLKFISSFQFKNSFI